MDRLPDHLKGLLLTVGGVLLVRLIEADPWTMMFWRGALMALGLGGFLVLYHRRRTPARFRAMGANGLLVAVILAAGSVLFILALNNTSVANTLVIVAAAPLIAAVFSHAFLGEPASPRTWGAVVVALSGIVVLASGSARGGTLAGDLAALGTAVCMAGSLVLIRRVRSANMLPAMALSGGLGGLVVAPWAAPFSIAPDQIWLLLILGLVVLPVSFGLLTLGPRYLPAPEIGLILLLETVLGPLWVWLVIGEEPGQRALVGGAIVISALIGHSLLALRRRAPVQVNPG
ncbi:MAG: DMT family transporter [Kiloniellaceae bacterium]